MADLVVKDRVTPPEVTTWEFDEIIAGGQRDRYAPVYAAAYPLRGRPRNQPWRDEKPVHRARRRVDAIAVS